MIFQVLKDGVIKGQYTRQEDVPSKSVLLNMKAHGYTFKKDGKVYTIKKGEGKNERR